MRAKSLLAVVLLTCGVSAAHAGTISFNFCPGDASCPADLTEASLNFTVDGTVDPNDYELTIRFVGALTDTFIDTIDFTTGLAMASMPVLTTAPEGTVLGDWTTKFDKANASPANNCTGTIPNQKFACVTATTGDGPDTDGLNEWVFSIDFAGEDVVSADSDVHVRVLFVDDSGSKVGPVSLTDAATPTTGDTPTTSETPTTGHVPEPAMLSLMGVALTVMARRLRRRPEQES
jgi:hypothetical protein